MGKIYYIGGSPCSGKSTIAELLEKKYGLKYFKLDDKLEEYMKRAKRDGKPFSFAYFEMTTDEIWLRDPHIQNEEELEIYREIYEYAIEDLKKISKVYDVITEGAGYLPELIYEMGVPKSEYICVVPTKEFQVEKYSLRPYIPYVLEGCSNKKDAFERWMERDALFALDVLADAKDYGYQTIIVDGKTSIEDNLAFIEKTFRLNK